MNSRNALAIATALVGLEACDGINQDTGFDIGSLSTVECYDGLQATRDETRLGLTGIGLDDGEVWFFLNSLDGADVNDLRCFVADENGGLREASYRGGEWTTSFSEEMRLTCTGDCETREKIADCTGGLGCDIPGNENGEGEYPLHDNIN